MAKFEYAPIVSDARGSIAGLTFSRWKTVHYGRRKTRPANPNTTAQKAIRRIFRHLNELWLRGGTYFHAAWDFQAAGRPYTGRNHLIGINVPELSGYTNLNYLTASPGMAGTVPVESLTVTGGVGTFTVAATLVNVPAGYTLQAMIFMRIKDANFSVDTTIDVAESRDVTSPYSYQFTAVPPGVHYGFAFAEFLAPDGSIRYGISTSNDANVT